LVRSSCFVSPPERVEDSGARIPVESASIVSTLVPESCSHENKASPLSDIPNTSPVSSNKNQLSSSVPVSATSES